MNDMMKHKKMFEIVIAICSHPTLKEAANSLGCDVRTIQRHMADEEFPDIFYEVSRQTRMAAAITVAANQLKAAATMVSLLESPNDSIRYKAASAMLSLHGPMISETQFAEQLRYVKDLLLKMEHGDEA